MDGSFLCSVEQEKIFLVSCYVTKMFVLAVLCQLIMHVVQYVKCHWPCYLFVLCV